VRLLTSPEVEDQRIFHYERHFQRTVEVADRLHITHHCFELSISRMGAERLGEQYHGRNPDQFIQATSPSSMANAFHELHGPSFGDGASQTFDKGCPETVWTDRKEDWDSSLAEYCHDSKIPFVRIKMVRRSMLLDSRPCSHAFRVRPFCSM